MKQNSEDLISIKEWIAKEPHLPKDLGFIVSCFFFIAHGHYLILDLSHWTLKMLTDANLAYFKQFLVYLVKAMPARPINIFCVNSPPFYEKLSVILKPMLPTSIRDKLFIFTDYKSLYSYIDRKYLPVEYGGETQSLHEKNKTWVKQIEEDREFFLNDDLWKANLSLKPDYTEADNELKGSFRALIID